MPATLSRGSRGSDVVTLQTLLNNPKVLTPPAGITADGWFGLYTEAAVKRFQTQEGLTADGVVGPMTWGALQRKAAGNTAPPPAPSAPGAPRLLGTASAPPGLTLYLDIGLGSGLPSKTGVFLPDGYSASGAVNLVVYFHGFYESGGIDKTWAKPHFQFREAMNGITRTTVLAAPTLGSRSQSGNITTGGIDGYIDKVLAGLGAHGPFRGNRPGLGGLVLACHSGGGVPMLGAARTLARYANHLRECWGFDCMYNTGHDVRWAEWARAHPGGRLFLYYIAGSPTQALSLSTLYENPTARASDRRRKPGLENVQVISSSTGSHNRVPIVYWPERIRDARWT